MRCKKLNDNNNSVKLITWNILLFKHLNFCKIYYPHEAAAHLNTLARSSLKTVSLEKNPIHSLYPAAVNEK